MGKAAESVVQHGIDLRLNKRVTARPAKLVGHRLNIGKAALIVDTDGAGIIDQRLELLDQHHADAHLPEVVGDRQANRAGAGNRDLRAVLYGGLDIRIGCCHFQNLTLRTNCRHCTNVSEAIC